MKKKKRLDIHVLNLNPELSRVQVQSLIMQGKVLVNGKVVIKPGSLVNLEDEIFLISAGPKYVSRAGLKLEKALEQFAISVKGLTVLDAGISTGGFTDCLLQNGAKKVYGIDVGYGQLHEKIRGDKRVVLIERTNLRNYKHEDDPVDLVTLDLSFISVLKVLGVVKKTLRAEGKLIVLIKPQFEAGKGVVPRGGVIKDEKLRKSIVDSVVKQIKESGFTVQGLVESPIKGASGNVEFLAYFKKN